VPESLTIYIGAVVMLRKNIDVHAGHVNGVLYTVSSELVETKV
jgi:hypothetical protein